MGDRTDGKVGFEVALKYNLQPQWEGVPEEAFMVMILSDSAMQGVASYRSEFDEAM